MAKKKSNDTTNIMEDYLSSLINEILDEREIVIKEKEAKEIISAIIPELDSLVSKRMKEHFCMLADFIKEKFSEEENQ